MAFPTEPPAPPRPTRPVQVTIAVWALFVLAAIQIITAILTLATMGTTLDATRDVVEGTREGDSILTGTRIASYVSVVLGVLFAAGFSVLAVFVKRGAQPARIVAWVALGLMLCCNGFGVLGAAAGGLLGGVGGTGGEVDQAELTRRIEEALPGWVTPFNYFMLFLGITASAAGIILLALPAANEFFRKREPLWEPPVPGAYYPAPGAPAQPGQPAQPAASAVAGDPVLPADPILPADPVLPAQASPSGQATAPRSEPAAEAAPDQNTEQHAEVNTESAPADAGSDVPAQPVDRKDKPDPSGQSGTGGPPPTL